MVRWLRICALNEEGPGWTPGSGNHMLQLQILHAATKKNPDAATKKKPVCCNGDERPRMSQLRPDVAK